MMSLLIQKEFFQLTPIKTAHEVLPLYELRGHSAREEYQAVYLGDERVGFGFTVLEKKPAGKEESEPAGAYELRHQTYLSFRLLGRESEMSVKGRADLDAQLYLKSFDIRVTSKDYWTQIAGQISKGRIHLMIEGKDGEPSRKILPVKEPILYSESLDMIWTPQNLVFGKRGRMRVWNPMILGIEEIAFRVARKEKIAFEGSNIDVLVVMVGREGVETRSWITPEGLLLRKESPTGLWMQKEENWKIFDAMRTKHSSPPDLPNLYSIAANRTLGHPEKLRRLKVKINAPSGEKILEIERADLAGFGETPRPAAVDPAAFTNYLAASEFVQSGDPVIQARAQGIAAGEKSALQAGLKIMRWVHDYVTPSPTVSLPSAKQVLAVQRGDCNEYTVLFTALARSIGIPTKMIAGLVYQNGRFFYHAWPEVYAGKWVGMDPTFNQAPVDVTHIPLVEGDIQEQTALIGQLGRIKVLILEAE